MKTARFVSFAAVLVIATAATATAQHPLGEVAPTPPLVVPNRTVATEPEWIVGDVVSAIVGMARSGDVAPVSVRRVRTASASATFAVTIGADRQQLTVVNHIWSPSTYVPVVRHLLGTVPVSDPSQDFAARTALTDLRVEVLLAQNRRISDALTLNMRSAAAHESAALLVGAFALRESSNFFGDVRPAVSRMAAHLAMAQALRGDTRPTRDGALAMVLLAQFAGLQRDALEQLTAFGAGTQPSDSDLPWVRALRFRVTGDWREHRPHQDETLLERFEYARAVRGRLGADAFLDYALRLDAETLTLTDWHRIALNNSESTSEVAERFGPMSVTSEMDEAQRVWEGLHGGPIAREALVGALNDRPLASPVARIRNEVQVNVLDWGTWAAFHQRHLCETFALLVLYVRNEGGDVDGALQDIDGSFGRLTLLPLVEGWIATTSTQYEDALARMRPVATAHPELLTAAAWNWLLKPPSFEKQVVPFPVNVGWFDPAVPDGTAYDLENRSLQPGCPRPPTLEEAAWFARVQPYDEWTVWSATWYPVKGKPSLAAVLKSFGSLVDYDDIALRNLTAHLDLSVADLVRFMHRRCDLVPRNCGSLAEFLLLNNRESEAAATYEQWVTGERNKDVMSRNVTWLVRYYRDHGKPHEAEALATDAAGTGTVAGLQLLAEVMEVQGRYDEAERLYRRIFNQYKVGDPLGLYLMRRSLATHDKLLEMDAAELLRDEFPNGLERAAIYALPATPTDGAVFLTFGARPAAFGLQKDDVIVAVDGWRVHNSTQYTQMSRLSFDDTISLIVWRNGQYRELRARVPQRWFSARFATYERAR